MGNCFRKQTNTITHRLINSTIDNTPIFDFKGEDRLCKVLIVYDGDTFTGAICLEQTIFQFKVRMYGYDSPEMRPSKNLENREKIKYDAVKAKNALSNKILNKIVLAKIQGFDKYGRLLANIEYSGEDVNKYMIDSGYGVEYFGGKKQ